MSLKFAAVGNLMALSAFENRSLVEERFKTLSPIETYDPLLAMIGRDIGGVVHGGARGGHDLVGAIDDGEAHIQPGADEGFSLHVRQQIEEGLPESLDVGDDDRLGMAAELRPRQLLDEFLQRADAAGQCHERVRALEHQAFPLVHVVDDDQLVGIAQHLLLL